MRTPDRSSSIPLPRAGGLRSAAIVLFLGALALSGCAHTERRPSPPPVAAYHPQPPPKRERPARPAHPKPKHPAWFAEGLASYYGPGLWGRKTASGRRLRKTDISAAHRTLPFGTCLTVLNLDNGRSVRVKVDDRGPYVDDRVIDVTQAAAKRLGMLEKGLAHVRLFRCGQEPVDLRSARR